MTELADVQDLGSCAARREGSSPFFRSIEDISLLFTRYLNTCCLDAYESDSGVSSPPFAKQICMRAVNITVCREPVNCNDISGRMAKYSCFFLKCQKIWCMITLFISRLFPVVYFSQTEVIEH